MLRALKQVLHPHWFSNFILSISFYVLKTTGPCCYMLFDDCQLELREWELLTFLGCIIVMKNRKQPTFQVYMGTVCMFAKILNTILYARQNPIYAVLYVVLCFLHIAFLPEPVYSGPEHITYFRGETLDEELERDRRITWLIEFYAAWSPSCVNFASVYAQLSSKYSLDNLKFGKVDITRFPKVAEKYRVDTSSWSKQLPTVVLFHGGKEVRRRPATDHKGRLLAKFMFSEENMVRDFELNERHLQCKKNPIKKKKSDLNKPEDDTATATSNDTANDTSTANGNKPKTE